MKPFITKETISLVQNYFNNFNENYSFEKYKFHIYDAFTFGEVQVVKTGDDYYLYLLENVSDDCMKQWKKDVGKVLSLSLKRKQYDNIYELHTDTHKILLKLVNEDEEESFKEKGFLHVKFGDCYYTILKVNLLNVSYASKDVSFTESDDIISEIDKISNEEDDDYVYTEEPEPESYSLF